VATHVDVNAERLRGHFVKHDGKKKLVVLVPREWEGLSDDRVPWSSAVATFTSLIRDSTLPRVADAFAPAFTTTDAVSVAACGVTLMAAMKKYFDYRMKTLCGIHSVVLEGEPGDWSRLRTRVAELAVATGLRDELRPWWSLLDGDLAKIEASAHGTVDVAWWQRMINLYEPRESGATLQVNGWLSHFFLYDVGKRRIDHARIGSDPAEAASETRSWEAAHAAGVRFAGLDFDSLPRAISGANVTWKLLSGAERKLVFAAGTWYAAVLPDGSVTPVMQWVVCKHKEEEEEVEADEEAGGAGAGSS
jgi:hypothetical protein